MTRRKTILLAVLVASLVAITAGFPVAWRAGALLWAKHSARQRFARMSPEVREILNATPAQVVLPDIDPRTQLRDSAVLGDYLVRFPEPRARDNGGPKHLRLIYSRFQVLVLPPFSIAEADAIARGLGFKDDFDLESTSRHTRIDDLDAQRDLPSLRHYLLLMSLKPNGARCLEEFAGADLRGYAIARANSKLTICVIDMPQTHLAAGVWFLDTGGLTTNDIHEFLAVLRLERNE